MLEILITFYKSIIHDTLISWNTECVSSTLCESESERRHTDIVNVET